jgi:glycosylphosphatidylinositol transamidase (GPIT) subunit GPI8
VTNLEKALQDLVARIETQHTGSLLGSQGLGFDQQVDNIEEQFFRNIHVHDGPSSTRSENPRFLFIIRCTLKLSTRFLPSVQLSALRNMQRQI